MRILMLGLMLGLLLAGTVCATEEQAGKWAVVDIAEVIRNHPKSESGRLLLEQQIDEIELEREQMLKDLEAKKEDFDKARAESMNKALSESAREEQRKQARMIAEELMQNEREVKKIVSQRRLELNDNKKRVLDSILVEIEEVIRSYAAKEGYAIVLDASAMGLSGSMSVLYYEEKNDITGAILKEMGIVKEKADE